MSTVFELMVELAALENPKARAINERHGDDHGVGLSAIRAIAKRVKTQHALALELWATGDTVLAAGFVAGLAVAVGGVVLARRLFPAVIAGDACSVSS